jgi:hypothetical protein
LDLQIKSYECLKFQGEVRAGRACDGANGKELTTCAKFWGQEVGGRGQGEYQKRDSRRSGHPWMVSGRPVGDHWSLGYLGSLGRRPWPTVGGDQRSPASRKPLLGQLGAEVFFKFFLDSFF